MEKILSGLYSCQLVNFCMTDLQCLWCFHHFFFLSCFLKCVIGGYLLYNIVLVSAYLNTNQPQVYIYPHLFEPPSHLSLHPIPLGCQRASGLSSLCHTANSHWLSVLHMIVYIFQCYSFSSSLLLLPLLCPQVVFYVCVSIAALKQVHQYHLSRVHIHVLIYDIFLFLISLCIIGSRFICLIRIDSNALLFMAE